MAVPSNAIYRNGQTPVTGDQYNTFVQVTPSVAVLRTFVGATNMEVSLLGLTTAGDGGAGIFWWNPSSTAADDGVNVIVPLAAASGAWNRAPITALFASGDFSGPPILPGYPLGQAGNLAYSLVEITTETVQPVTPEFALSINMISSVGSAGSVPAASNKVGAYIAIEAEPGSGNVWALNPVTILDAGACLIGGSQIAEFDFANLSGVDFGVGIATAGLLQPASIGMQVTGGGPNANSAAIAILGFSTSLGGCWNAGIVFAGNSVNEVSILDENSLPVSYKMLGAYDYGIDTASAAFNEAAVRLGSQQTIAWRNAANSADIVGIQSGSSDQIVLGGAGVAFVSTSNDVALGADLAVTGDFVCGANAVVAGSGVSDTLGFFGSVGVVKQTATGSRAGNAALATLLTILALHGLLVDGTSA